MVWKLLLLTIFLSLALAGQAPKCSVCQKVAKCPKDLFQDSFIDPVFNFLAKQISAKQYPNQIKKKVSQSQARYFFIWESKTYLAIVDLKTNKFKIMEVQKSSEVVKTQKQIGTRSSEHTKVSAQSSEKEILKYIDENIRSKMFSGMRVKCIHSSKTNQGYYMVYQQQNGEKIAFIVTVKKNGDNVMINFEETELKGQKTSSNEKEAESKPEEEAQAGGYRIIESPLKNAEVMAVLSFLINKVEVSIKYAALLKAEIQIVSGCNIKLTISFDTASPAVYEILVYKKLDNSCKVTSIKLLNASQEFEFKEVLTSEQLKKLPFLGTLQKLLIQSQKALQTKGTILKAVSMNYPYFRFVYRNQKFSRLEITLKYQVFSKTLKVLHQSAIGHPPTPPESPEQSEQQSEDTPQEECSSQSTHHHTHSHSQSSKHSQQKNNKQNHQHQSQSRHSQTRAHYQRQQVKMSPNLEDEQSDSFESISQELAHQSFIQQYVEYLASRDNRLSRQNLVGIFWMKSNHNFLKFRFRFPDGTTKSYHGSVSYIQFKVKHLQKSMHKVIPFCLQQHGNVCLKCAFKYFLNGGKCYQVPDECSQFDYQNNICNACYQGYYLDYNNVCQEAHFLCKTSDKKGNCLSCYRDYRLTMNGRCAYQAEGCDFSLKAQEQNPLCSKFNGLSCLSCVQGCYMSPQGSCKVPDPNCETFDPQNEKCLICMEGYYSWKNGKKCKRQKGY